MNILALDTETPKFDKKEPWKGNVHGDSRPPVCWSWANDEYNPNSNAVRWGLPYSLAEDVQAMIDEADLVVFFNGKHDVGYLRREGVDFSKVKVYDVQLGEFVLGRQLNKFPSLADTCLKYQLPTKLDVVKTEYWDKGIDTDAIPWDTLSEYAAHDAAITLACYHEQQKHLTDAQKVLVSLMSQDMMILQEMEATGITFDEELCKEKSTEIEQEIESITKELQLVYPNIPINFGSGDNLSAFLYGGLVIEESKEHVGFFKTGQKAGQPKYKNVLIKHQLPPLFKPVPNTLVKKSLENPDGPQYYETNEGVLNKLKGKNKPILDKLLRLAKLDKLNGTYYKGLPQLCADMHWPKGKLHGRFNQVSASTGRLSSVQPNQQNFASELQNIFISTY